MKQLHCRWIPKCQHEVFQPDCLWCADLNRITREISHEILKPSYNSPTVSLFLEQELESKDVLYPRIVEYPPDYESSGIWETHLITVRYSEDKEMVQSLNKFDLKVRLLEQNLRDKYGITNQELSELSSALYDLYPHDSE